jgi:formate--tetrahydrofolate ligase
MRNALLPIQTVARKLELPDQYFEQIGPHSGKVKVQLLANSSLPTLGKLILVTATTPTVSGEGKTVTTIGLAQGLAHVGKKAVVTLRQPSLGPVFGMKGGVACGLSQVDPSEKINLHFHCDFHAIATAQNLLAALIDAQLSHGNDLRLIPDQISWPRTIESLPMTQ